MDSKGSFLSEKKAELNPEKLNNIVRHALVEDIGRGDITTQLTIPKDKEVAAGILIKEGGVDLFPTLGAHFYFK